MRRDDVHARFLQYYESGFRTDELVGIEVERICVNQSGCRLPYDGPVSVSEILKRYSRFRNGSIVYEDDQIVGVIGPWGTVSIEPGGQIEWSSPPCQSLSELGGLLDQHNSVFNGIVQTLHIKRVEVACDLETPNAELQWVPRRRYQLMREFLSPKGGHVADTMARTASVHSSFDYRDFDDWRCKFRCAVLATPLVIALFANSPNATGTYKSMRQRFWADTDPERCFLPACVFSRSFSIEQWVEWVCQIPTIFQGTSGKCLVPTHGVLLDALDTNNLSDDDLELHLSTVFTYVRSYKHIEIRTADVISDDLLMAVPAFWSGLLYHSESTRNALSICSPFDKEATWHSAVAAAAQHGLDARVDDRISVRSLAERLLAAAVGGLRTRSGQTSETDPAESLCRLAKDRHGILLS